jgi:hypothetical protein
MQSDGTSIKDVAIQAGPVYEWWTILNELWAIFWFKRPEKLLTDNSQQLDISTFHIYCDFRVHVICCTNI